MSTIDVYQQLVKTMAEDSKFNFFASIPVPGTTKEDIERQNPNGKYPYRPYDKYYKFVDGKRKLCSEIEEFANRAFPNEKVSDVRQAISLIHQLSRMEILKNIQVAVDNMISGPKPVHIWEKKRPIESAFLSIRQFLSLRPFDLNPDTSSLYDLIKTAPHKETTEYHVPKTLGKMQAATEMFAATLMDDDLLQLMMNDLPYNQECVAALKIIFERVDILLNTKKKDKGK